jgi:hypothetical protein
MPSGTTTRETEAMTASARNAPVNSANTSVRELVGEQVNFTEEASWIQSKALYHQTCVVRLGQIIFFSSATGDAWMLDPEAGCAICLAQDSKTRPIPIQETATKLAIEWNADYKIEDEAFTAVERTGATRTIIGYPTAEIMRLVRDFPAGPRESFPDLEPALVRLKSGRNEPCPCGSGTKYKKCCLANDETMVRQSIAARQTRVVQRAETIIAEAPAATGDRTPFDEEDSTDEAESELPPEVQSKLDEHWDEFEALVRPTSEQMDAFLASLLALPAEVTDWGDLFHRFARHDHAGLPGVFRRIVATVPHTEKTGMGFFYWAAAEEFVRLGHCDLLPDVAAGFRKLDLESYDPDALTHLEDYLLAEGFDGEALELGEHFLPIERADDGLTPWAVPMRCNLIFELRVGRSLPSAPDNLRTPDLLAEELCRGIEEEIHPDSARTAAEIITGQAPAPLWTRPQFDLVPGDISKDEKAWRDCQRLYGNLLHVAREAWQVEQRPPASALRGLTLMLNSVYHWLDASRKKRSSTPRNLLNYLQPAGLEERLVQASRDLIGVNKPRARQLLEAHEILLRFATRHQLISDADAAQSQKEIARLKQALDRQN